MGPGRRHFSTVIESAAVTYNRRRGTPKAFGIGVKMSEGMMTGLVPGWRAGFALVASYALILQALLYSLGPSAHAKPNHHDSQSVDICLLPDDSPAQGNSPAAPAHHPDAACCILCAVPVSDMAKADALG